MFYKDMTNLFFVTINKMIVIDMSICKDYELLVVLILLT